MVNIDRTKAKIETSQQFQNMVSNVDYHVDHNTRFEVSESVDPVLEKSSYEQCGYKGQDLREFRLEREGEFIEPISRSFVVEKFGDPSRIVEHINPRYKDDPSHQDLSPYKVNCADCARCVERTWRGSHEEAAGRRPRYGENGTYVPHGEPSSITEEWAGEEFSPVQHDSLLRETLLDGGHGSSAIIHSSWERDAQQKGGGHAYNVVNYHGNLRVLDGQTGESFDWERGAIHPFLGRDPKHMAMAWNAEGGRIW